MRHRRRLSFLPTRVHRSVVGLAAIGLLASGTLAAPGAIAGAEIALQDDGALTWFVEDETGSAVHSTTYDVTGPNGWSLAVGDNLRDDTNTTHGTVTITGLPEGEFTITPTGPEGVDLGDAQSVTIRESGQTQSTPVTFVAAIAAAEDEAQEELADEESAEDAAPAEESVENADRAEEPVASAQRDNALVEATGGEAGVVDTESADSFAGADESAEQERMSEGADVTSGEVWYGDGRPEPGQDVVFEQADFPAKTTPLAAMAATPFADVPIGTVQARMRNQQPAFGNCITYSPTGGVGQSSWVTNAGEAQTGHGTGSSWGTCPTRLSTTTQSVLGFNPVATTTVATDVPFLLGRMSHYNNPVYLEAGSRHFNGLLDVQFAGLTLTFPWAMDETPNSPVDIDDVTTFTGQIADQVIDVDGIPHRLVVLGFTESGTAQCPASPAGGYVNEFVTQERTTTHGCLYAQLTQVRTLQVEKIVDNAGGATIPNFPFTTTSTLAGSPWNSSFGLRPAGEGAQHTVANSAREVLAGAESITIAETLPAGWALTATSCVDGAGNTVASTLSGTTLSLDQVPAASSAAELAIVCTFTNTSLDDLSVSKTATLSYDRVYSWSIEKMVQEDRFEIPEGGTATAVYDVTVTAQDRVDSDITVTGEITVTNDNPVAFTGVDVTDALPGAACTVTGGADLTVGAGSSATVGYECTADSIAAVGDTNTATATWDAANYPGTSGQASGTAAVAFGDPDTETDRHATVTDAFDGADPVLLPLPDGADSLDWEEIGAGNDVVLTYTQEIEGAEAGACTAYPNAATVVGDDEALDEDNAEVTVCVGADLTIEKNVIHSYDRTYGYDLDKDVDQTTLTADPETGEATFDYTVTVTDGPSADSNWAMSGTITVTNPNDWLGISADVTDQVDIGGGATCTVTDGADALIPAGSSVEFDYVCTFAEQPSYDGTNTATVTWANDLTTPGSSASGTADVEAAEWDVTPINQTVTVIDDQTDPANPVQLGEHTWTEEGATTDFTYELTLEGVPGQCVDFTNTAWLEELPDVRGDQGVTVCWPQELTVDKTVNASYETDHFWLLDKEVDRTEMTITEDGTAEFDYVVTATPDGSQDRNWAMDGTITVTNPNATEVTVAVTDTAAGLGEGVICTVADPELTVPASGEAGTTYSCTFEAQPAYDGGTNTATVTWTDVTGVEQSATDQVEVDFVQGEQTHVDVQVWDDMVTGESPGEMLGTAEWNPDGTPTEFAYSLELSGAAGQCVDHTNTAVIPTTGDEADQTVTVCVERGPEVSKTAEASYDRSYAWDITKEADRTQVTIAEDGTAEFDYVVSATPDGYADSGWVMDGQITVTNPNVFEGGDLTVTVTDQATVGGACVVEGGQDVVLFPGQVVTLDYTCSFEEQPEYGGTNTATAVWTDVTGTEQTATGAADVTFELEGETNAEVEVYDDQVTLESPGNLLGTAIWHDGGTDFDYSLELEGVAGECTDHTNTAVIPATGEQTDETVTVCVEAAPEVAKTAAASYDREYFWDLDKNVDATAVEITGDEATFNYTVTATPDPEVADSNWALVGFITVTNPNQFQPMAITVTDIASVGAGCAVIDGEDVVLEASETRSFNYACTFEEQPDYEGGSNTAFVDWTDVDGTSRVAASDPVAIAWALENETNDTIKVFDNQVFEEGDGVLLGAANWHDGTAEFGYDLTLPGVPGECVTHTNTAVIAQTDDDAQADVTICVQDELVITKTVETDFDRAFLWDLTKEADQTELTIGEDGTATFDYTVSATPGASVDSNWSMTGQISVTNPNAYAEGTVSVQVTDEASVGGSCAVLDGEDVVVTPGATQVFDYTCTFGEQPAYEGVNTATVTWTGPEGDERTSTVEVPVTFEHPVESNRSVEVYDDKVTGAAPGELLGTAEWNAEGTATLFDYSLTLPGEAGSCVDHTNTALIPATGDEAQETVTVCTTLAPEVSKTVEADYDRAYDWSIAKEVDRTRVVLTEDGTAEFNYVVSATPQDFTDSGWTMGGQVTVTNPNTYEGGELTLTVIDVPSVGGECTVADGADVVLAPEETRVLDYTCTFEEQPEYAGTNLASVAWSGPGETSGTATAQAEVDFVLAGETNLDVDVHDDKVTGAAPGEFLGTAHWHDGVTEFAYSLDLPGEVGSCVDHTNTAVILDATSLTGLMAPQAVGDEAFVEVTVCIEAAPEVTKTAAASYDREYFWDLTKVADATEVEIVGEEATFSYVVAALADGFQDSGWEMSGEITVTNPNDFQELAVTVTDVPSVGGECVVVEGQDVVLAAGETRVLGYECSFEEQPDYEGSNTAIVTWTDADGVEQATSSEVVPVSFELDQESNLTVEVFDNQVFEEGEGVSLGTASWHDGTTEFGYDLTLPGVPGECVTHTNIAVIPATGDDAQADVTVCVEDDLVITKTAEAAFERTYAWELAKEADQTQVTITPDGTAQFDYTVSATPNGYADSNWSMTGQISVTNPNAYAEGTVSVQVTDEASVGGSCAVLDGEDVVVAPGATQVFDYSCTFGEQPAYEGVNTATVTWTGPEGAERSSTVEVPVTFEVDETAHASVEVYDDKVTGAAPGDLLGTATWNAEGTPTLFSYSLDLPGEAGSCVDHTNTAVIPATDDGADEVVTVCVEAGPEVVKTAEASYDRVYDWELTKAVDRTQVELPEPGMAEFDYVVTATPDGYTDSGWEMSGEVTVINPNDFQELAVTVTDVPSVGGECVVGEGQGVILAAGETRVLGYECSFEEQPDYEGSNTAIVTWTDADGVEQASSSEAAPVSFDLDQESNLTVEVHDDMVTGEAPGELLGTADWRDGPTEFAYSLELAGVADECVDYTNTAVIPATGDEAKETVQVCVTEEAAPEPPVDPTPPVEPEPVDPTPPVEPGPPAQPAPVIPTGDPVAGGPQVALVATGLAAMILALLGVVLVLRRRQD